MSTQLKLELTVKDDGSVVVKQFGQNAEEALGKVENSTRKTAAALESNNISWKSVAAGAAAAYAAFSALRGVFNSVSDAVKEAARFETMGVVMRVVGNNAGYTGAQMDSFAASLEKTGILMINSRESLSRMIQAHLDLNKASALARIAQDAAVIGNINSSEAFERLVYGIQSAQVEMLRTIGINVNFENSYAKVAKETGRAASSFTETEKAAIRMNAVIESGQTIAGTYEAAMGTAGKQLLSLERHFENLKVLAGEAFTPALAEIVETITGAVVGLNGELSGESKDKIANWGNNFRLTIISVEAEIYRLSMFIDKVGGTLTSATMLLTGPGRLLGIESMTKAFESAADANIALEKRYQAHEKELEILGQRYNEVEASMSAAGKAGAKSAADAAEQKRMAAASVILAQQKQAEAASATAAAAKAAGKAEEKAARELERTEKEVLRSTEEATKAHYAQAIAGADQWLMVQRENGAYERTLVDEYYDNKNEALWDWYDNNWEAIEQSRIKEEEKTAKLETLNAEYYKNVEENENTHAKNVIDFNKKQIEIAAKTYKSLNAYSDDAIRSEIRNIQERYKQERRYLELGSAAYKASLSAEKKETTALYANLAKVKLAYYTQTGVYAKNADAIIATLANDEYQRVLEATNNEKVAAQARTDFVVAEYLKKAAASQSFFEGVKAGLADLNNKTYTWGQLGIDTVKSFSQNAQSTMSSVFFDAYKGNLKSAGDYFKGFTDSMAKTFFDALSKMIVEAAVKKIVMSFGATWTEGAGSVLNAVGKVLGYAADWFFGSSGDNGSLSGVGGTDYSFMSYAHGGFIPGYAMGGDSYSNDTVHAMLSPGEYVVPRSMIQSIAGQGQHGDTMLAHINTQEAALLKALGGAGTVNERTGLPQFFGFGDILNIATGGLSGLLSIGDTEFTDPFLNPLKISFEDLLGADSWQDVFDATFDPITNPGITKILNETGGAVNKLVPWFAQVVDMILPIIGGAIGTVYGGPIGAAGGAAAGSGIASKWNSYSNEEAVTKAAITAAATYITGVTSAAAAADSAGQTAAMSAIMAGDETLTEAAIQTAYNTAYQASMNQAVINAVGNSIVNLAKSYVTKWAIGEMLNAAFPAENGTLGVSFEGMSGGSSALGPMIASLAGNTGGDFAFPARNGLDYVPRDNFYIRAHEGEAVLTKKEATSWRQGESGGASYTFNLHATVADKRTMNEFAEKIDVIISKNNKRRYSS